MSVRPLIRTAIVLLLASPLAASACAIAKPAPFLPPSRTTPAAIGQKAAAASAASASAALRQTSKGAPRFPIPASERLANQSANRPQGTSPSTSTTFFRPSSTASPAPAGAQKLAPTRPSTVPLRRVDKHGSRLSSLSGEALYVAILAALVIIACLVWAGVRWFAFEPHFALAARHSLAEASFRMSATLSEFADFIRLGR